MKIKTITGIYLWEFIQNLPALVALLLGMEWWPRALVFAVAMAGGLGSALAIALTEHHKDPGYREPVRMLVANTVGFSIMILLVIALLNWAHGWMLDLLLGLFFGAVLACVQNLVQKRSISVRHVLAIGLGSSAALSLIAAINQSGIAFLLKVLIVNSLTTGIIVVVDYVVGLGEPKTEA